MPPWQNLKTICSLLPAAAAAGVRQVYSCWAASRLALRLLSALLAGHGALFFATEYVAEIAQQMGHGGGVTASSELKQRPALEAAADCWRGLCCEMRSSARGNWQQRPRALHAHVAACPANTRKASLSPRTRSNTLAFACPPKYTGVRATVHAGGLASSVSTKVTPICPRELQP